MRGCEDATIAKHAFNLIPPHCAARSFPARNARAAARGFAAGRFGASDLRAFVALGAGQDIYFDIVRREGSPAQQDALKAALASAASTEVARMREVAITSALASQERRDRADW